MSERPDFGSDFIARHHAVAQTPDLLPVKLDKPAHAALLAEHIAGLRDKLRENIPNNLEGIDTASLEAFFAAQNLPHRDFLVMDEEKIPNFNRIIAEFGWPEFPETVDTKLTFGVYPPGVDLAVVVRYPDMEAQYGPIFTEAQLAHELAHGTHNWNEWSVTKDEDGGRAHLSTRVGQQVVRKDSAGNVATHHGFLEEGFASMITAEYLRFKGAELQHKTNADIAGGALQQLVDRLPELRPALIQARSNVQGLRDVARIINQADPNLYDKLNVLPYTKQGLELGAQFVNQALNQPK